MRVLGFIFILISCVPLGFAGWTEFIYLSEVSSRYENQIKLTDNNYKKQIEIFKNNAKKQINIYKNNTALPQSTKDQMIEAVTSTNDKMISTLKTQYDIAEKKVDEMVSNAINQVRSTYYTFQTLALGFILLAFGLYLGFRPKKINT